MLFRNDGITELMMFKTDERKTKDDKYTSKKRIRQKK